MTSNVPDESSDHAELNEQLERLADPKKERTSKETRKNKFRFY